MRKNFAVFLLVLAVIAGAGWVYVESVRPVLVQLEKLEKDAVRQGWPTFLGDRTLRGVPLYVRCQMNEGCRPVLNRITDRWRVPEPRWWGFTPAALLLFGAAWVMSGVRPQRLYTGGWAQPRDYRGVTVGFPGSSNGTLLLAALSKKQNRFIGVREGQRGRRERGHVLVVGPSRSGKSLLLLANLLSWRHSAVVLDVKPELYRLSGGIREALGPVYVLNPKGIGHQFDPFPDLLTSPEDIVAVARQMMRVDQEREKIFAERAAHALAALFNAAVIKGIPALPFVASVVGGQGMAQLVAALRGIQDEEVQQHLAAFLGMAPGEFDDELMSDRFLVSCWGTLVTRLMPYLTPGVLAMTAGRSFTPRDLVAGTCTVYLQFSEASLPATSGVFALLVQGLMRGAVDTYDQVGGQGMAPLLLAIDEGGAVPVPNLPDILALSASRGISVMLFVQSLAHLSRAYGTEGAAILQDNMHHQVYYAPRSLETAKHLSEIAGRVSLPDERVTEQQSGPSKSSRSVSHGERDRPLITPDEARKLPVDAVLVVTDDLPIIRARRVEYFRNPLMSEFLDPQRVPAPRLFPVLPMRARKVEESSTEPLPAAAPAVVKAAWQEYEELP